MAAHWSSDEAGMVRSSLSVYLELMTILGAYRDALVLVGGWVPHFLLEVFGDPDKDFRHVGSLDIDLAVDHRQVGSDEYATIVERLERHDYRQRRNSSGDTIPSVLSVTSSEWPVAVIPSMSISWPLSLDNSSKSSSILSGISTYPLITAP